MKNKWVDTRVNVCDRTVRNPLNEMRFTYRKAKRKTPKQKKTKEHLAKEKQSWSVEDWMKVILTDQSPMHGQGYDAESFVWCRSNEI